MAASVICQMLRKFPSSSFRPLSFNVGISSVCVNCMVKQVSYSHSLTDDTAAVIPSSNSLAYIQDAIVDNINHQLDNRNTGRLFAVIQIAGKQRKVTVEDIICINGGFHANVGERIRLEKILLVGSKDFTVIGRPMLQRNQVSVEATVIEKTLEVPKIISWYLKRKNHRRMRLTRTPLTMLRINSVQLNSLKP